MFQEEQSSQGGGQSQGSHRRRIQETRAHKVRTRVCFHVSCDANGTTSTSGWSAERFPFGLPAVFQFCGGVHLFLFHTLCHPPFYKRSKVFHWLVCAFQKRVRTQIQFFNVVPQKHLVVFQRFAPPCLQVRLRRGHRCDHRVHPLLLPLKKAVPELVVQLSRSVHMFEVRSDSPQQTWKGDGGCGWSAEGGMLWGSLKCFDVQSLFFYMSLDTYEIHIYSAGLWWVTEFGRLQSHIYVYMVYRSACKVWQLFTFVDS